MDILSNKLIKIIFPSILPQVTKLVNLSLTSGLVPHQLKISRIIPIFKEGDKHSFTYYRPISLLGAFGKFHEKIVCT